MKKILLLFILLAAILPAFAQTAGFTASTTQGCAPLVVNFTNTSANATSYTWDFGNASGPSYLTSPSASYTAPGTYTVTLTATGSGGSDTKTMTITVYPSPTVAFNVNDTLVCPGTSAVFTDQTNLQISGSATYSWNFGDGNSSPAQNPAHPFYTSGYYNITETVINSKGCVSTLTKNNYIHVLQPPSPAFSVNANAFCSIPGHAIFTNQSTGLAPLSYYWSFGDNTSLATTNPAHDYLHAGTFDVTLVATDGNGCKDTLVRPSYIRVDSFVASFTTPTGACLYSNVSFTNTTTNLVSSHWDFGDGGTATSNNATHQYTTAGTYTVTLAAYDGSCYDTVTHQITINPEPSSSFTFTPAQPCPQPQTIQFSSTAPAGSTYSWAFGDGGTSTQANPSHPYSANGFDTAILVVTSPQGCKDTVTNIVRIYNIIPVMEVDTISGCSPLTVHFKALAQTSFPPPPPMAPNPPYPYSITGYTWSFGDGSPNAAIANPVHTYTLTGKHTVYLTITTANGCTATDSALIEDGHKPSGSFTFGRDSICIKDTIHFHATTAVGDTPITYIWLWGDGTSGGGMFDTIDVHKYQIGAGSFTPSLVLSNYGCNDTIMGTPLLVQPPTAEFAISYSCDTPTAVHFHNQANDPTSVAWSFGDGMTSNSLSTNITHVYPSVGSWTVLLTVYNDTTGCRDSIQYVAQPYALTTTIQSADTAICLGDVGHITHTTTGGFSSHFKWYVNGSLVDTASTLNYQFPSPGYYTISFTCISAYGCIDSVYRTNYMLVAKPVDSFIATPLQACLPSSATFTDASTDIPGTHIVSYAWSFGDNTSNTVTTDTTSHYYTTPGNFDIREIVTDNVGCKDTLLRPQYVHVNKPHATFSTYTQHPCVGQSIQFVNNSTGSNLTSYWNFGDGDTSSATSPYHAYNDTGSFTVRLIVVDPNGCRDTATQANWIHITSAQASFTMSDSTGVCVPLQVQFTNTSTGAAGYYWSFGNSNTSFATNPSNPYTAPGYYTVMLVATNSNGCHDTATAHVNLYGYAGAFTYSPVIGCKPLTVTYTANVSNVAALIWDFADGTIQTSAGLTITHTYTSPGAYIPKLILNDTTGCQASSQGTDTIKVEGIKEGYVTMPSPVCIGDTVSFTDTSKGFFAPVRQWYWQFNDGQNSFQQTASHYYGTAGTFTVLLAVTDSLGCKDTLSGQVHVNDRPVVTASKDTVICLGDAAQLSATGATAYTWSPATSLSCVACASTAASPSSATTYVVTGTDGNGCTNEDSVVVSLQTKTTSVTGSGGAVCLGDSVQLSASDAQTYTWVPSDGISNVHSATPMASPQTNTTYMVIAQEGSCTPDTGFVQVTVHPLPKVVTNGDQTIIAGNSAILQASGSNVTNFSWAPAQTLSCNTCSNPTAQAGETTTYTVTGYTDYGCEDSAKVTIHVLCDKSQVFIPNTFTPNGDGQNDVFYPRGVGIKTIKSFRIYDRWGQLIFERKDFDINDAASGWDGTYKGQTPRPDVYVYAVDATCASGEDMEWKGDVTIVR